MKINHTTVWGFKGAIRDFKVGDLTRICEHSHCHGCPLAPYLSKWSGCIVANLQDYEDLLVPDNFGMV